jgi:hypothetical protein
MPTIKAGNLSIGPGAQAVFVLPATCQNSNIACLVLGTDNQESMTSIPQIRVFRRFAVAGWLVVALSLNACSNVETCEEPAFYESAQAGKRIEAPDDLDNLATYKELTIPEASPRPPRDRAAGCLDKPPTLDLGGPEEESETP